MYITTFELNIANCLSQATEKSIFIAKSPFNLELPLNYEIEICFNDVSNETITEKINVLNAKIIDKKTRIYLSENRHLITKIKNDFQLTDDLNHLIKTGIIHFKFILESEDRDLVLKLYEFKKLSEELKKY